jgi:hypothetical protein
MAGTNENDLLIADFCKQPRLTKINRQSELGGVLNVANAEPTAMAPLGCFPFIAHREANGGVLSRVNHLSGAYQNLVLATGDAEASAQPGPTSFISAVANRNVTGAPSSPFPASAANFSATHIIGGNNFFTEAGGGFQILNPTGHSYDGFGGGFGPYWSLKLPPSQVFNGVDSGRMANHIYDNYILMPVVSFHCEPLSLRWNAVDSWYEWVESGKTALIITNQVGGGGSGEQWRLDIIWNEVRPCLLAPADIPLSALNAGDAVNNGAGLFRSYSYKLLEADVTMPDHGGSMSRSYSVAAGDLRVPLVAYTASSQEPASWSLTFESLSPTSGGAALPTPQRNPFDTGPDPDFLTFDNCHRYDIPNRTDQDLGLGDGTRVYLEYDLNITGGFSKSGFIELVKDPLATQNAWNVTPRYYEMIMQFTLLTGLP